MYLLDTFVCENESPEEIEGNFLNVRLQKPSRAHAHTRRACIVEQNYC